MDQDYVVLIDRSDMDFDAVESIFQIIGLAEGLAGEFALLSGWNEACAQFFRQNSAENEAARLQSDYFSDALVLVETDKAVGYFLNAFGVGEKGGNVLEMNTFDGEFLDNADVREQFFCCHIN